MSSIRITYPPNIYFESNPQQFGRWPTDDFSWLNGLMEESDARTTISPEILQYQVHVSGNAFIDQGLTRNIAAIEVILYFLHSQLGLENGGNILELCSGTGNLTTPLGAYFDVVAIEKKERYVTWHKSYLARVGLADRIKVLQGDITQQQIILDTVRSRDFKAVIINSPWIIIQHAFEIAAHLRPKIIIAVLPLDVIEETDKAKSFRYSKHRKTVEENRKFIASFRAKWEWGLIAVEPALRQDGTAQIGTFLFA